MKGAQAPMSYAVRIQPGKKVRLSDIDPNTNGGLDRKAGDELFASLAAELGELQELLYAASTHSLLVILQGIDTAGKDGTIRHVFRDVDPLGMRVVPFKVPTPIERDHDFLWRIHHHTPEKGMTAVFNRSQYEDVLVVRVHELAPKSVWSKRFDHINNFERLLVDSDTIIAKYYLHISREEQEERLLDRERDVEKAWKLSAADWVERRSWEKYMSAYEEAIQRCNTEYAPWEIVPANRKWFRNVAVAESLVKLLRPYREQWLASLTEQGRAEIAAIRAARGERSRRN
jgi:PPK2 family polyphosphate:nucleotide phosphotransferase